jgi:hypothetical protein
MKKAAEAAFFMTQALHSACSVSRSVHNRLSG